MNFALIRKHSLINANSCNKHQFCHHEKTKVYKCLPWLSIRPRQGDKKEKVLACLKEENMLGMHFY